MPKNSFFNSLNLISIDTNNRIDEIKDNCLEGNMVYYETNKLLISFERLSPKIHCEFILIGNDPINTSNIIITADDRSGIIYPSNFRVMLILAVVATVAVLEMVVMLYSYAKYFGMSLFMMKDKKIPLSKSHKKTDLFLKQEFGTRRLRKWDSIIIHAIHDGKTTKPQIISYTKIHPRLIDIRLKRLKQKTILLEEGIFLKLHPIIENYFQK